MDIHVSKQTTQHILFSLSLFQLSFFQCRADDKIAVLLYLLKHVIKDEEQTVVFAATKHHVEYLSMVSGFTVLVHSLQSCIVLVLSNQC